MRARPAVSSGPVTSGVRGVHGGYTYGMSEQQAGDPATTGTDISAADLDVDADDELAATSDPESFTADETVDGTLGGLGGAEGTSGGAG